MGDGLAKNSQAKITKILLVFFALLFAAILIHPEWDLPEVHDVKITSARHLSGCLAGHAIQPLRAGAANPLLDLPLAIEWFPQSAPVLAPGGGPPILTVLRV